MAILSRRGPNNNFDPEKLLPGEWAVVLSGDPNADDGMSVYICFSAGTVKRMATYEDMQENINAITEDIRNYLLQGVSAAISNAESATSSAMNAAESASNAAESANSALSAIQSAVSGTVINDSQSSQYTVFSSKYVDDNFLKNDGEISDCTTEFSESIERENIETGESAATIFGKIKKFFADLKTVAFTGLYSDLSGRPTLGNAASKNVANNLTTSSSGGSVLDAYQGKLLNDKKLDKSSVVNSLLATIPGSALDAVQGKKLDEKITQINEDLTDEVYDRSNFPIHSFYDVTDYDLRKNGNKVFFNVSLSLNESADFEPNTKYKISPSVLPDGLIPKKTFCLSAFGCDGSWGNTVPVSAYVDQSGDIWYCASARKEYFKIFGHWVTD